MVRSGVLAPISSNAVSRDLAAKTSLSLLRVVLNGNSLCPVQIRRTMRASQRAKSETPV